MTRQNEYINFYNADDIKLADGTNITAIELRLSKDNDGMAPLLNFSPSSGQCITLDTVKKRYPQLRLTDYPRGRSGERSDQLYSPKMNGQKVSFSFTVKNPHCLVLSSLAQNKKYCTHVLAVSSG
jgi:hypothetical protein